MKKKWPVSGWKIPGGKEALITYFQGFLRKRWKLLLPAVILLFAYVFCLPNPLFETPYSTVLEDRDGRLLAARIAADGQWRFPEPDSLPAKYVKALVAYEDRRFFYHPGFDPIALGRALLQNIRNGAIVSGGSTLSMQVIRLSRKRDARSIYEKCVELILATRLELKFTKKRILRLYASQAPFGGNVVGIEAASWRYFGKPPQYLSWAEAALLAVLPNNPALIHPGRNRTALLNKRNRLLKKLAVHGIIDNTTLDLAQSEPLPDAPIPLPQIAPHLLARAAKTHPDHKIQTTLDAHLQQQANEIAAQHNRILVHNGIHNLAALILHVPSGEVLAYVGNAPDAGAEHGAHVDIIAAPRSTGSILKPLLYACALQDGSLLPKSLLPDVPMNIHGYRPENFHREYDGAVPADEALSRSLNVPFVHLLRQYGIGRFHYQLNRLGLTTIKRAPDHYGLTLILGGAEATLWDLSGVYGSMARTLQEFNLNNSRYRPENFSPPSYLMKASKTTKSAWQRQAPVFDAGTLWTTFSAMQEVQRPESEGQWQYFTSSRRVAWKTGTSFGFRDAWSIGLTPEYLVGVWVGNADGEGRPDLVGSRVAAPLMFDLFALLPPTTWFNPPFDELQQMPVCRESGWPAGPHCPENTVPLPKNCANAPACAFHQLVHLDPKETYQVSAGCQPANTIKHKSWMVLPALEEFYYRKKHPEYRSLPPFRPDCQQAAAQTAAGNAPMQMIYPLGNAKIFVPRDLDGQMSRTVFKLAHRKADAVVYWHLDNEYLGSTQTFHHFELYPSAGTHLLTLVDEDGNRLEKRFVIVEKK